MPRTGKPRSGATATRANRKAKTGGTRRAPPEVPHDTDDAVLRIGQREVALTNLRKIFWPGVGTTKGDLLRYYTDMSGVVVPHVRGRAMVMKRYPNGVEGKFFFMKRAPTPRPDWITVCSITHARGNVIEFPVVDDAAALLWIVNLGCIDLNPWYGRCDDVDRPDVLHFDLDPVPPATFERVAEVALIVREELETLGMPSYPKTTGSKGIHVYVPIERGPLQKEVWTVAKALAQAIAARHPKLVTAEYRIAKRPAGRVLIDYNQNAWGRTLASVYSVRPRPIPTVSAPVTWTELEKGVTIDDFRIETMPGRVQEVGDLWAPVLQPKKRVRLEELG